MNLDLQLSRILGSNHPNDPIFLRNIQAQQLGLFVLIKKGLRPLFLQLIMNNWLLLVPCKNNKVRQEVRKGKEKKYPREN